MPAVRSCIKHENGEATFIGKEKKEEMLADLRERNGLFVQDFEVLHINFIRDSADVRITYSGKELHFSGEII